MRTLLVDMATVDVTKYSCSWLGCWKKDMFLSISTLSCTVSLLFGQNMDGVVTETYGHAYGESIQV